MEKLQRTTKNSSQTIDLSSIYTEKEIESMKKLFPKLSSLLIQFPNKTAKSSSIKSTSYNYLIEKEAFIKLITEKMLNILNKEDSDILAKSITYMLKNEPNYKKVQTSRRNTGDSSRLMKNHMHVNISEKSKVKGNVVFSQERTSSKSKKSKNKDNYPHIRKNMNLNVNLNNTNDNHVRSKFGKKYIDIENDHSNYNIKDVKGNSIINNFITFSNAAKPEHIIVYQNNSSKSKKSNVLTNSNNSNSDFNKMKNKNLKKKEFSLNLISNYVKTERNKTSDTKSKKKYKNSRKSNFMDNYTINFINKIEKLKTEFQFDKRKKTGRPNKRQSDVAKKSRMELTNFTSNTVYKKVSVQMKPNIKEKELTNIKNINLLSNSNIESIDFDIFSFELSVGKENTLYLIGTYIFKKFDFAKIIKQKKFENWSKQIAAGYSRLNPYHTDLHGADVTQTCFNSLLQKDVIEIAKLDNVDICCLIMSCMCHDFKHGGLNNNFLRLTKNKLAIRYNDISILENMHISETFKLINSNKECDIFSGVDKPTYEKMRKKMISCVLSTDMAHHSEHIEFMNVVISKKDNNIIDNQEFMNLLIHSADISNPTKPFNIYLKWAKLVVEEFCQQGDKEKELGLVCTCDRNTVNLSKNQIGFIDFVVDGFVSSYVKIFPSLKFLHDNLVANREKFVNYKDDDYNNNNKIIKK